MKGTQTRSDTREARCCARGTLARLRLRDERGQVLILAALMVTVLLGFLGLLVDGGLLYAERRQAQNAADEATLAAVRELGYGGSAVAATAAALENAAANGFDNNGTSNTVTVNIPPISGEHIGDPDYVEVIVSEEPTTFFIHVVTESDGVSGRGVAGFNVASGGSYALFASNSDCGNPDTLEMSGNFTLVNGGVHSNGNVKVSGNNNQLNGGFTYSCNMTVSGNNNTFDPAASTAGVEPLPVSYTYGDFPCTRTFSGDTDLRSVPDIWVGGDPNSNQLLPGVYCSTGKLTISGGGGVTGSVTLVAQGEISISSNNTHLTPYWNGVVLFTEDGSTSAIDISGNSNSWEGLIFAPNGRAKVQGETGSSLSGAIIADTIQISGQSFSITAIDYGQGGPASIALVE